MQGCKMTPKKGTKGGKKGSILFTINGQSILVWRNEGTIKACRINEDEVHTTYGAGKDIEISDTLVRAATVYVAAQDLLNGMVEDFKKATAH